MNSLGFLNEQAGLFKDCSAERLRQLVSSSCAASLKAREASEATPFVALDPRH